MPIDVSKSILEESAEALVGQFPKLRVTGYAASYQEALEGVVEQFDRPKLYAFLGSSLGNYEVDEAVDLLATLARDMDPADRLLLGTDLDKDPAILRAAYDDAQGVTARFNLNLLTRINRELGGRFDPTSSATRPGTTPISDGSRCTWSASIEQDVFIPGAGLTAQFDAGESIHTENSHKYTLEILRTLADRAGFVEEAAWTDRDGYFRLQSWRRPARSS